MTILTNSETTALQAAALVAVTAISSEIAATRCEYDEDADVYQTTLPLRSHEIQLRLLAGTSIRRLAAALGGNSRFENLIANADGTAEIDDDADHPFYYAWGSVAALIAHYATTQSIDDEASPLAGSKIEPETGRPRSDAVLAARLAAAQMQIAAHRAALRSALNKITP